MSDRFRQTAAIWNWLPAFRAVAETEHLPSAGQMLSVTPPALSRSIRNLEEALGRELFDRTGRSLKLNEDGQRLALAVRSAMRQVHSAVADLNDEVFQGAFRWTSMWSTSRLVVDVLAEFVRSHARLTPQMLPINSDECPAQLQRGELDLAVLTQRVDLPGLTALEIGPLPHGSYCGPTHPLAGRQGVEWAELAAHPFGAPLADAAGNFSDGWPVERMRRVTLQFAQMEVGYQACRAGHILAVLPDNVADGLWKLRSADAAPTAYAVYRSTITAGPAEAIATLLRQR